MISVVVVAYNSADTLDRCLRSLAALKNTEVILVDNQSSDNSVAIAKRIKGVRVIETGRNLGFNGGNQVGYEASTGDIVVFLNPDASVTPAFSTGIERAFSNHPEVGVVGCRIHNADGSLQPTCNRYPSFRSLLYEHSGYHRLFPNSRTYKRYIYDGWDRRSQRYVKAVSGACTAVRRSTLEKIGGLDTNYFLFYEEPDLSRRVEKIGQRILFIPNPIVTHVGSTSTKKSDQTFINATYLKSRDYYVKKFHGPIFLAALYACKFFCDKLGAVKRRLSPQA